MSEEEDTKLTTAAEPRRERVHLSVHSEQHDHADRAVDHHRGRQRPTGAGALSG